MLCLLTGRWKLLPLYSGSWRTFLRELDKSSSRLKSRLKSRLESRLKSRLESTLKSHLIRWRPFCLQFDFIHTLSYKHRSTLIQEFQCINWLNWLIGLSLPSILAAGVFECCQFQVINSLFFFIRCCFQRILEFLLVTTNTHSRSFD